MLVNDFCIECNATNGVINVFLVKGLADEIVGENMGGAAGSEDGENSIELMHQPLSVALWISQALMPIGMPQWFGPLNKNEPTTLRVALHIQVSNALVDLYLTIA